MPAVNRYYSSVAIDTTLKFSITNSDLTLDVNSTSGFPTSYPYTLAIGYDLSNEELVTIIGASGTTLTVGTTVAGGANIAGRGVDGTNDQAHAAGEPVKHVISARDMTETQAHIAAEAGAHGITGSFVGTTDTQTLTNKTITGGTVNPTTLQQGGVPVATTTGTQTLTNKTVNLTSNTLTGTIAEFNTALSDADFATTTTTQTLTNKTLTSPTITGPTISGTITGAVITSANIVDATITGSDIASGTVTSTNILDGTIVNADINASAAIDKTKISGTAITAADTGTVTSTMITDGTIVNADINASAAIDKTKISGTAITVADTGTITGSMIADNTIFDAEISSTADIAQSKIAGMGAWTSFTPTLSGGWSNGNGTWDAKYALIGKTMHISAKFVLGSGTGKGTTMDVSIPSGFTLKDYTRVGGFAGLARIAVYSSSVKLSLMYQGSSSTTVEIMDIGTSASYAGSNAITNTLPAAWATGDYIVLNFTVEVS